MENSTEKRQNNYILVSQLLKQLNISHFYSTLINYENLHDNVVDYVAFKNSYLNSKTSMEDFGIEPQQFLNTPFIDAFIKDIEIAVKHIGNLKLKKNEKIQEKINNSFLQTSVFEKESAEKIINCNLLIGPNKPIERVLKNISENSTEFQQILDSYGQNEFNNSNTYYIEFYNQILKNSNINLQILNPYANPANSTSITNSELLAFNAGPTNADFKNAIRVSESENDSIRERKRNIEIEPQIQLITKREERPNGENPTNQQGIQRANRDSSETGYNYILYAQKAELENIPIEWQNKTSIILEERLNNSDDIYYNIVSTDQDYQILGYYQLNSILELFNVEYTSDNNKEIYIAEISNGESTKYCILDDYENYAINFVGQKNINDLITYVILSNFENKISEGQLFGMLNEVQSNFDPETIFRTFEADEYKFILKCAKINYVSGSIHDQKASNWHTKFNKFFNDKNQNHELSSINLQHQGLHQLPEGIQEHNLQDTQKGETPRAIRTGTPQLEIRQDNPSSSGGDGSRGSIPSVHGNDLLLDNQTSTKDNFVPELIVHPSFNTNKGLSRNLEALQTLKVLLEEKNAKASIEQKKILSQYIGFGGLKEILTDPFNDSFWKNDQAKTQSLVKEIYQVIEQIDFVLENKNKSINSIKQSILSAFYTPEDAINAMYQAVEHLGFKNGNILDPSAGIGLFTGLMPQKMRNESEITQIEIEPMTAAINRFIYDNTNVINLGYENAPLKSNYNLIISNIPFGDFNVYDRNLDKSHNNLAKKIHSYYFLKSLLQAQEGAIIAFMSSKALLDSPGNQDIREFIEKNSNFLGAVRLPNNTFKNNANTQVVTDIIFLQKTAPKSETQNIIIDSIKIENDDEEKTHYLINNYFAQNPEFILGDIKMGGMYSKNDYTIIDNGSEQNLAEILTSKVLPAGVYYELETKISLDFQNEIDPEKILTDYKHVREGSIFIYNNQIYKKLSDTQAEQVNIAEKLSKINHYVKLRDAVTSMINAELYNETDEQLDDKRAQLRFLHHNFKLNYGKNYKEALKKIEKVDDNTYNVLALIDKNGNDADILTKRVINPLITINQADNVEDAIAISLYESGKLNIDRISQLLSISTEELLITAKGKIFKDHEGNYFRADEYLSGNVKFKLQKAKELIQAGHEEYQINFDSLKAVIPKDIPYNEIQIRLGARWIDTEIYIDFVRELLKWNAIHIHYDQSDDGYIIKGKNFNDITEKKYGTSRIKALKLIELGMHLGSPAIKDKISSNPDRYVINKEETAKAHDRLELIKESFEDWIFRNPSRKNYLVQKYNDLFNTTVLQKKDGQNLQFPGLANIKFNPHQKDCIWGLIQNNGGIVDHIVGSGKTYIMVGTAMKLKQMGIANKPMIIALKSTIKQIQDAFNYAYPNAKILSPSENDFKANNRKLLFAKIANSDWDCIIITHDNFKAIEQEKHFVTQFIEKEIEEVRHAKELMLASTNLDYKDRKSEEKKLETRIKKLEEKLQKELDKPQDNVVTFQQMGIDHLMVDESQQFKNLSYVSKLKDIAGMSKQTGATRSINLMVASRWIQEHIHQADKGVTFLSGTPISNSGVEMYLLLKYLRPYKMKEIGLNTFDQWATTFVEPVNDLEFSVTGTLKQKTRFSKFMNVPELAQLYSEIADIRDDTNLTLDKPIKKTNGYMMHTIQMDDEQKDFNQKIVRFAETKDGTAVGLGDLTKAQTTAYMLLATNLSTKMAVDMRLVDKNQQYNPEGKIGTLVATIKEIYERTQEHKGTQLIFSDIGTPKAKGNQLALVLGYLEDEMSMDQSTLGTIFGDNYQEAGYKFPKKETVIKRLQEELLYDDQEIEDLFEQAKLSEGAFNVYQEIKHQLIKEGINENEIVFIHSYDTDVKKQELFDKTNKGEIRIILGSTQKLGTGVNVQERLLAIHHLDVPWRPSDLEQRNGRGIRQGNKIAKQFYNNEVEIHTYGTEMSLDAYKYQLLFSKDNLIRQIKNSALNNGTERIIEQLDDLNSGDGLGHLLGALSGNMDILTKKTLEKEIEKLKRAKRNHTNEQLDNIQQIIELKERIPEIEKKYKEGLTDTETLASFGFTPIPDSQFILNEIDGKIYKSRKEYGEKIKQLVQDKLIGQDERKKTKVCHTHGLIIYATKGALLPDKSRNIALEMHVADSPQPRSLTFAIVGGVIANSIEKSILSVPVNTEKQLNAFNEKKQLLEYLQSIKEEPFKKEEELQQKLRDLEVINARMKQQAEEDEKKSEAIRNENGNQEEKEFHKSESFTPMEKDKFDALIIQLKHVFPNINIQTIEQPNNKNVLGYLENETIFINQNKLNPNTPIHELGHLWINIFEKQCPTAYENIKDIILKDKALMNAIENSSNYKHLKGPENQIKEALAGLIGNQGEKQLELLENSTNKNIILQFINTIWDYIALKFTKNTPIHNWTTNEFKNATPNKLADEISKQILGLKPLEINSNLINSKQLPSQEIELPKSVKKHKIKH